VWVKADPIRAWLAVLVMAMTACTSSHSAATTPPSTSPSAAPPGASPAAIAATPPSIDASEFPGPQGLWFRDSLNGWGADGACNVPPNAAADACAFQAAQTDNGGKRWVSVGAEQTFLYVPLSQYDAAFIGFVAADLNTGWVIGSHPMVTHDRGLTWAPLSLPPPVSSLAPVTGGAWALAGPCSPGATECQSTVYHQAAGVWTPVTQPPGIFSGSRLLGVSLQVAYVVGSSAITVTTDSGTSWQPITSACNNPWGILAALGTANTWSWCGDQPSTSDQTGQLFRSRDGGRTWTVVADNAPHGFFATPRPTVGNMPTTGFMQDLIAVNHGREELYLSRFKFGLVARSLDGGTHWTTLLGDDGGGGYRIVIAKDGSATWAVANSCLYRTIDGGGHWVLMKTNGGYTCGPPFFGR